MGNKRTTISSTIEEILNQIIDEWYERIAPHYVTQINSSGRPKQQEQLKRFHDERGHRIKFNKEGLDFTYGLRSQWETASCIIEVSVNNKVNDFNYDEFHRRLLSHYDKLRVQVVSTPHKLKGYDYQQIFQLEPNRKTAFDVEKHKNKADIMKLSFRVDSEFINILASNPIDGKKLIEGYCVSPFRSVYATVYRRQHQ